MRLQPQWPWCLKAAHKGPPFFPTDEVLSVIVAAVMGLQHALAMVGGIVTPPLIIGYLQDDPAVANCKRLIHHMLPHVAQALSLLSRLYVICRSCGSLPDRQWYLYLYSCKRLLNLVHAYCHHHHIYLRHIYTCAILLNCLHLCLLPEMCDALCLTALHSNLRLWTLA